jgi:hypothetical protein
VHYGTDGLSVYLRLDFDTRIDALAGGAELRVRFLVGGGTEPVTVAVKIENGAATSTPKEVKAALAQLLEIEVPFRVIRVEAGVPLQFSISLWQGGLPLGTLPHEGWLHLPTAEPADWTA